MGQRYYLDCIHDGIEIYYWIIYYGIELYIMEWIIFYGIELYIMDWIIYYGIEIYYWRKKFNIKALPTCKQKWEVKNSHVNIESLPNCTKLFFNHPFSSQLIIFIYQLLSKQNRNWNSRAVESQKFHYVHTLHYGPYNIYHLLTYTNMS